MNERETLLIQNLKHWQESQEQLLVAQNTYINKLAEELKTQGMHQEAMQTQLNEYSQVIDLLQNDWQNLLKSFNILEDVLTSLSKKLI